MVYVLLANGFEEIEAITPIDILRRAGLTVKTVAVGENPVLGAHNIPVLADIGIGEVVSEEAQLIILPGGMPGTTNLESSDAVCSLVRTAFKNAIPIGAICAAPSILGHMGLLRGKNATCFPGFEDALTDATVKDAAVVVDGTVITARGAGCAAEFGFALAALLAGRTKADALRRTMQYKD